MTLLFASDRQSVTILHMNTSDLISIFEIIFIPAD